MFISRCLRREEGGAGGGGGAAGPGLLISFLFGGPAKWEGGGILNHRRGGAGRLGLDVAEGEKIVEGLER